MHETALASALLKIVLDEVEKHEKAGGRRYRVTQINLKAGLLVCLEEKTLRGCFELLAEESPLAGARLAVRRPPLPGRCATCGREVETSASLACPACGGYAVDWRGGREMEVASIEALPL